VKLTSTAMKSVMTAAGMAAVGVFTAATATASPIIQGLGTSETLVDGPLITDYTVSNLQPAGISIPGYTPKGQIWQAEINARANSGVVTPVVANFNARTTDNVTYRVISTSPTPDALSPAPITQGGQTSGKVYFDVTGAAPTNVVYNDGAQDVLVWTTNSPNSVPGQAPNAVPSQSPTPAPGLVPGQSPNPAPNPPAHT
jgi:Domain of unknown function (DUF1942)